MQVFARYWAMSADMAEKLRVQEHKVSTRSQRPVLVVASDSLGQSSASRKRPRADARQSDEPVVVTKILKRYGGTINLYKECGFGPPVRGQPCSVHEVYFDSGIVETQEELDEIADKIRTYGFTGSMGGKGSRVHSPNELHSAAEKRKINFTNTVLIFAVWEGRRANAAIESVHADGGVLTVRCTDAGMDRTTIDARSGQKWVSFAAATVKRPVGGGSWRPVLVGAEGVRGA